MNAITLTLNPRDRLTLTTTIERLINLLDSLDPDPDLEDGGDAEPSIGGPPKEWDGALQYDLEADDSDLEPDMGWTEATDQTLPGRLSWGDTGEPWLGFTGIGTGWREGEGTDEREGDDEREQDYAEQSGIGDADGLREQLAGSMMLYHYGAAV